MKKLISLFFILTVGIFGESKKIQTLEGLKVLVKEELNINNEAKKSEYSLNILLPDKIKKEVIAPSMNKGEIFLYSDGEKTIYLPFFNQSTKEKATVDENKVVEFLKSIIERDKKDKTFQSYYAGKLKSHTLASGEKVNMDNFKEVDGYLLPTYIEIFDKTSKVATLNIEILSVNPKFSVSEFQIKK